MAWAAPKPAAARQLDLLRRIATETVVFGERIARLGHRPEPHHASGPEAVMSRASTGRRTH